MQFPHRHHIILGEYDTTTNPDCDGDICAAPIQKIKIALIYTNNYNSKEFWNDIAVIKLRHPANLNGNKIKYFMNIRMFA